MGTAPSLAQIQRGQAPRDTGSASRDRVTLGRIEAPSGRYRSYRQRDDFFSVQYPDNWRVYESQQGLGVTIAPEGGVVEASDGTPAIVYGAIVNHYDPFEQDYSTARRRADLPSAMDDLVRQVRSSNSYLRRTGSQRRMTIDGAPALQTVLSGTSTLTGQEERVTVFVRELSDGHVAYALFIAPGPRLRRAGRRVQPHDRIAAGERLRRPSLRVTPSSSKKAGGNGIPPAFVCYMVGEDAGQGAEGQAGRGRDRGHGGRGAARVGRHAAGAAQQVLLRPGRHAPVRADHGAARVLPDAHRVVDPHADGGRHHRPRAPAGAGGDRVGDQRQAAAAPRRHGPPPPAAALRAARHQRARAALVRAGPGPALPRPPHAPGGRRLPGGVRRPRCRRRASPLLPRLHHRQPGARRGASFLQRLRGHLSPGTRSCWAWTW